MVAQLTYYTNMEKAVATAVKQSHRSSIKMVAVVSRDPCTQFVEEATASRQALNGLLFYRVFRLVSETTLLWNDGEKKNQKIILHLVHT